MKTMQPLAIRMPHVFQGPRAFSQNDVRTHTTRNFGTPTPPEHFDQHPPPPPPMDSPDLNLPIMSNNNRISHEPDYFAQFSPGLNETYIAATPHSSQNESHTWSMANIPYEIDMDIYLRHKLDVRATAECIEKAQLKLQKKGSSPRSSMLAEEYRSKNFGKVVLNVGPYPSTQGDQSPIQLKALHQVLGEEGLLGFYHRTEKYYETHFRIRDVSESGRGRYVAVGKLRKGTFRGSGSEAAGGGGYFAAGAAASSPPRTAGRDGPARKSEGFDDAATLDGERNTNAEYEAFKARIQGMNMRI